MENLDNFKYPPAENYIDRLVMAFVEAGNAAKKCTTATKKLAKVLDSDHVRRTKMYYRRSYRHGGIQ
jgi:hypothetical protein